MADNLATFVCRLSLNPGASTSWNPLVLFRPVIGLYYLFNSRLRGQVGLRLGRGVLKSGISVISGFLRKVAEI